MKKLLALSGRKFKIPMINKLICFSGKRWIKSQNKWEISIERWKPLRKIKSNARNKNMVTEIKTAFDKLISKLNTVRKASVNLKMSQQKALTVKHRAN